jgi:hypothetical protein
MKKKQYICITLKKKGDNMESLNLTLEQIRAMEPGRAKMEAYNNYMNKPKKSFTSKIRRPKIKR